MIDERAQRLMAIEAHTMQVVRLPLGPFGGGGDADEAWHGTVDGGDADRLEQSVRTADHRAYARCTGVGRCVQAGEPCPVGERVRDRGAVVRVRVSLGLAAHTSPCVSAWAMAEPGSA